MAGKYFEELELGARFAREPGRTLAAADNLLFTALTLNPQPNVPCSSPSYGTPVVR